MAKDICAEPLCTKNTGKQLTLYIGIALFSGGQHFGCKGNRASLFRREVPRPFLEASTWMMTGLQM